MNIQSNGNFIISLDFELLWGVHDHETKESFSENIMGARKGIQQMLSMFQEYGIHATWGVVGLLMAENPKDCIYYSPEKKPEYETPSLSSYGYFDSLGQNEADDIYHYAHSLVSDILKYEHQEIGSHTFSHYYCLEKGQTIYSFEDDLKAAQKIANDKFGLELKSLILPRNQFNEEYLKVAHNCNFISLRGNPRHYAYNNNTSLARGLRLLDAYTNICGKKSYSIESFNGNIINLKASAFFRHYDKRLSFLEPFKINCIKHQMKKAAQKGEIFHLWWHPHNIGKDTEKNLQQIRKLLAYYCKLNSYYGFESKNMKELAEEIINENSNVM